jgi:hypothetical protein
MLLSAVSYQDVALVHLAVGFKSTHDPLLIAAVTHRLFKYERETGSE